MRYSTDIDLLGPNLSHLSSLGDLFESQYDEVFATRNISNNKTPLVPSDEVSVILNKFNSRIQNYFDSLPEEGEFKLNNLFKHKNIYKA